MKTIITFFVALLLLCSPIAAQTAIAPAGSGTQSDPYKIANIENLYWLSQNDTAWGAYYEQTANINASATKNWDSGKGFSPIGNSTINFTGIYNGKGFTIDSLSINRPSSYSAGLFGETHKATIDSLELTNSNIQGKECVGNLIGYSDLSTVKYCYSSGSVVGQKWTGGLVGKIYHSTINSCSSNGSVSGNSYVGGLIGYNSHFSIISSCSSTASVSGNYYVGGLIGENYSINSIITYCYSTGSVSGTDNYIGGLIGENNDYSIISYCYSSSCVSGNHYIGGLVGYNHDNSTVNSCYSTGLIFGNGYYIGGLIGYNSHSSMVDSCYSTGMVAGKKWIGELVGENDDSSTINCCYYNSKISGQLSGIGFDNNNQIVTALTSNEMKQSSNFVDLDFNNTWGIQEGSSYPALLGVSNNAPFAFADTLAVAGRISLNTKILANDCDYETVQKNLCYKIITSPTKGSLINGVYSFDDTVSIGNTDSLIYRIGEYTSNDTLWGNYATIILTKVENTAPILQSVNDTTIDKDTPLTLSLNDVTATDADGDNLSLIVTTADTNCTITGTAVIPNSGFAGDIALLVAVTDGIDTSKTLTMNLKVDGVISVNEITPMAKDGYSLRVAPTPTRDAGKIVVTSNVNGDAVFTIYTRNETKIATMKRDVFYGKKMSFDWPIISKLDKGVYYIEMKVNGDRKAIARIVKINK